jgi:hypothetical protein
MKVKLDLNTLIYSALIVLSLAALAFAYSSYQFTGTKVVYEGF